ncbi:hypothetical protein OCU04_008184 [Sclerotinia nivalis]|uniref:Uncharacterized protein n=1 Tax=Sclerotinia nivalis TaxID=352851 RepID=A0A9X0AHJ8_9HELO|nr:hypothetical protein OCU04_008184 [Sclerotinia nivalis]
MKSTTNSSLSIPTVDDPNNGQVYCFSDHNDDTYVPFNITGDEEVLGSIFKQGNTLSPGGPPYTYMYTDPKGVYLSRS